MSIFNDRNINGIVKLLLGTLGIGLSGLFGVLLIVWIGMNHFSFNPDTPSTMQVMLEITAALAVLSIFTASLITVIKGLR